jgi:hypothetical protein
MSQLKNIISIQQGGAPVPPYTVLDHCYFNNSPVSLGFKLKNTTTLLKISFTTQTTNWIFGARDYQTASDRFTLQASTGVGIATNNISATTTTNISDIDKRIDYSYDGSTVSIVNNGETYTSTNTRGFPNGNRNLVVGCIRNGGTIVTSNYLKGYFWGLEIYEANVLAHNIIPIKDDNDVICLYDTVEGGDYKYPSTGTLLPEQPLGLNMINPGSLQMNLNSGDELDVEPNDEEDM